MSALDRIALVGNAQTRFLMIDVARELKRRHGSRIHLYCGAAQQRAFYTAENSDGVFDSIDPYEPLLENALQPVVDPDGEIATARAYEARLGRTYNSLAVGNRHLGRGYALGGFYHARSRHSEGSTLVQMMRAYNLHFAFWDGEVDRKGLTLILGGPVEVANAARLNGLPWRNLAGAKYGNLHYWAHNEFNENPELAEAFERASTAKESVPEIREAYKLVGTTERRYRSESSVGGFMRRLGRYAAQRVYWRLRGYEKAKGYYRRDEVLMLLRRWRDGRRMTAGHLPRLADLNDTPFVFFPLATEPEVALQQFSPEFFFQHAAIAALSRDLPAGVRLVVKETIVGVGRRPDNFYDQIAELKNVVWMNMLEPGIEVARRAAAVAVITGSTGFEAAVMGKPVISLGCHNGYNMLPHVFHVTDLARTGEAVARIFCGGVDRAEARRAAARYLQAVIDTSFDLGAYDYVNLKQYDADVVSNACNALERSVGIGNKVAERIARAG